ncbi:MAG: hypothetical protein AVDCRST_MAG05-788, partial [uncultured Rubrobacteraceae bacterium]
GGAAPRGGPAIRNANETQDNSSQKTFSQPVLFLRAPVTMRGDATRTREGGHMRRLLL